MSDDQKETDQNITDPSNTQDGESEEKKSEAHSNIPENLKDKSTEDIVKMYSNLEKKLGEMSNEIGSSRKVQEEYEQLKNTVTQVESVLSKRPDLYQQLQKAVKEELGGTDDSQEEKGSGEVKPDPVAQETRAYQMNRIMTDFQKSIGLDKLKADEKKEQYEKVMKEFLELRDPGGNKDLKTVLNETPLHVLPNMLEKSYFLANVDQATDPNSGFDFASIGSLTSSTRKSDSPSGGLTDEEKIVAKSLGMSESEYIKQKDKIEKERKN